MSGKNIHRVMIITGDDNLSFAELLTDYQRKIEAEHGPCIVEYFDAAQESVDAFMSRAMTASMFGEVRLYCLLHAQTLKEEELAVLDNSLQYSLQYDIPDVYIYISAEVDKSDKQAAKINKHLKTKERIADSSVCILEKTKPAEFMLAKWIEEHVAEKYKRKISRTDAQILADNVEYNLLDSEIKKMDMVLPKGAPIDAKVIENIVGVTKTTTAYDFAVFLGNGNLVKSLQAADTLFSSAPLVVSALFRHFWSVFKVKKFLEKTPELLKKYNYGGQGKNSPQYIAAAEIGVACGIIAEKASPYFKVIKSCVVPQSQKFSKRGLAKILKLLQQYDVGVKTGKVSASLFNLQLLCYKIARTA